MGPFSQFVWQIAIGWKKGGFVKIGDETSRIPVHEQPPKIAGAAKGAPASCRAGLSP